MTPTAAILAILVAGGLLVLAIRRSSAIAHRLRRGKLAGIEDLLVGATTTADADGFPIVRGRYREHAVVVALLADRMAVRKLPALWLQVGVEAPLPVPGSLSAMMRFRNIEYWSPIDRLTEIIDPGPDFPAYTTLRCNDRSMVRVVPLLAAQHAFLADPRGKEILVTPVRVRLTWLAEEGDRGSYLLLRQTDFTADPIPTETIRGLLDRAATIADKIISESPS